MDIKEILEKVIESAVGIIIVGVVIYFTVIQSGYAGDLMNGYKYNDPADYFTGEKEVFIVVKYKSKLLSKQSAVDITLNGISLGKISEGNSKTFVVSLDAGQTYRLRASRSGSLTKKETLIVNENTIYYYFTYDNGDFTNDSSLTLY